MGARGLGGKAPIRNPVRGPRDVERTYGLFAVRERAANASLFAVGVRGRRSEGVKKILVFSAFDKQEFLARTEAPDALCYFLNAEKVDSHHF